MEEKERSGFPFQNPELPIEERVEDLVSRLTLDEKYHLLSTHQAAVPRLGIGEWCVGQEIARGYVSRDPDEYATVFPQPIGLASTFDPELMEELGKVAGTEARYYHRQDPKGHLMVWGPTVDPERDPRWGRTEEGYGEDPYLICKMTAAYTRGMAGDDPVYRRVIPTLKHFCANNTENARDQISSDVTPRTLHEYYYRAFSGAILEGKAGSVMTAYNEVAGVPACMNPDLQNVLKDKWGLTFVVTDGSDFSQNVLMNKTHATHAEALADCIHNGCDLMTDDENMVAEAARDAVERGLLTEEDLDKVLRNVFTARFQLGEFDGDACPYNTEPIAVDMLASREVNRRATKEQICLLRNQCIDHENFLPLRHRHRNIAVIGPLSNVNYRDWYSGQSSYQTTILEGIQNAWGGKVYWDEGYDKVAIRCVQNGLYWSVGKHGKLTASARTVGEHEQFWIHEWGGGKFNLRSVWNGKFVTEDQGYSVTGDTPYSWDIRETIEPVACGDAYRFGTWLKDMDMTLQQDGTLRAEPHRAMTADRLFEIELLEDGVERAAKKARKADVVLLCLGNNPVQVYKECYDRPDLELIPHQKKLSQAIRYANPDTILLLVSSYPYNLSEELVRFPAILYTTHAGAELGNVVADTLLGKNNPSARCPITWYSSAQDLPSMQEYDIIRAESTYLYTRAVPIFPFGHGLSYTVFTYGDFNAEIQKDGIRFTVGISNDGKYDGDEVVQLYYHMLSARVKRPQRQLCAFQRVSVPRYETRTVVLFVSWDDLKFYDVTREIMAMEAGDYVFEVGASSRDIRDSMALTLPGDVIPNRDLSAVTKAKNFDEMYGIGAELGFSQHYNDWYAAVGAWGGGFAYQDAVFNNYSKAILTVCAPNSAVDIDLYADDTLLGRGHVTPCRGKDDFRTVEVPLEAYSGVGTLRMQGNGTGYVYSLQFV